MGMEGADWMEASRDASSLAPSNDQTQTTKAHAARSPLAALPPRDGAGPAGTADKDAAHAGDAGPVNWLGTSGRSGGASRRADGGADWAAGRGEEAGLARGAENTGDGTPDKGAARPDSTAFMERFLHDSRTRRLTLASASSAEISRAAAAAAQGELHGSEREQMRGELGALEESLRFLELDLVSLMERSRDDLYEIDFWRGSAEDEIFAARRRCVGSWARGRSAFCCHARRGT